jgi:hypothetical protein
MQGSDDENRLEVSRIVQTLNAVLFSFFHPVFLLTFFEANISNMNLFLIFAESKKMQKREGYLLAELKLKS